MKKRIIFEPSNSLQLARRCKARRYEVGLFLFLGTYGATPEDSGLPLPSTSLGGASSARVDCLTAVSGGPFFIPASVKQSNHVSPSCRSLVARPGRRSGAYLNRGSHKDYFQSYSLVDGSPPVGGRKGGDCDRIKGSLRSAEALIITSFHVSSYPAARLG